MKVKSIIVSILMIFILSNSSYAAIEIVPSRDTKGTDGTTTISVSNSYLLCRGMTDSGQTLAGATVQPHLVTNADWGAVSYLSNSVYGTNSAGKNTGVQIMIDSVKYYSTTGNLTGVMNWGSNPNTTRYTQTASLIKKYTDNNTESTANDAVEVLYQNKDERFVDVIDTGDAWYRTTYGLAMVDTNGIYSSWSYRSTNINYPICIRQGLFGFNVGNAYGNYYNASGAAHNQTTFRPVIWNK